MRLFFLLILITTLCKAETVTVKRVIDGDTYILQSGDKVRMIGINTPERGEPGYEEAKQYLKDLIEGEEVELEMDDRSSDRDKYGRLLRYTYYRGNDVHMQLIQEGYAYAFTRYAFDKSINYKAAEIEAQVAQKGLWASNGEHQGLFRVEYVLLLLLLAVLGWRAKAFLSK